MADLRIHPLHPTSVDLSAPTPLAQPTALEVQVAQQPTPADVTMAMQEMTLQKAKEAEILRQNKIINENIGPNHFVLSKEKVDMLTQSTGLKPQELLQRLIPIVKRNAQPPISNYFVGCAALGKSGAIYTGVNIEFLGCPLNQAVHGEQFLITNARLHGEAAFDSIAISAAPCGHCRQFMNEIGEEATFDIITFNNAPERLQALLPRAFGPQDLDIQGRLMTPCGDIGRANSAKTLEEAASIASTMSYVPYTQSSAGIALRTKDGKIYSGYCLENAAYNPSLSPLQVALIALLSDMRSYNDIVEVCLAEKPINVSQKLTTEMVLKSIVSADIKLQYVNLT